MSTKINSTYDHSYDHYLPFSPPSVQYLKSRWHQSLHIGLTKHRLRNLLFGICAIYFVYLLPNSYFPNYTLVGGFTQPTRKILYSHIPSSPQVGMMMKIENIWNHHLVYSWWSGSPLHSNKWACQLHVPNYILYTCYHLVLVWVAVIWPPSVPAACKLFCKASITFCSCHTERQSDRLDNETQKERWNTRHHEIISVWFSWVSQIKINTKTTFSVSILVEKCLFWKGTLPFFSTIPLFSTRFRNWKTAKISHWIPFLPASNKKLTSSCEIRL